MALPEGIYDALLSVGLKKVLEQHPELRSIFGKLDPEEGPARYAAFVGRVLEQALLHEADPGTRLRICNDLLAVIVRTIIIK